MNTLKFKTNVKCNGCKKAITPCLDGQANISSWKVDIFDPERILIVEGDDLDPIHIINLLREAGYHAELM